MCSAFEAAGPTSLGFHFLGPKMDNFSCRDSGNDGFTLTLTFASISLVFPVAGCGPGDVPDLLPAHGTRRRQEGVPAGSAQAQKVSHVQLHHLHRSDRPGTQQRVLRRKTQVCDYRWTVSGHLTSEVCTAKTCSGDASKSAILRRWVCWNVLCRITEFESVVPFSLCEAAHNSTLLNTKGIKVKCFVLVFLAGPIC